MPKPTVSPLLDKIRHLHTDLKLAGKPKNALLHISDDLLFYILSLLRNAPLYLPEASLDEWFELLTLLNSHGVLPLFYWKIGHLSQELCPPESVIVRMRTAFMKSQARTFQMERQLFSILGALNNNGIRALVLKGSGLAWSLYPDPATRPSNDIDILVLPEEFAKAREILHEIGYQSIFEKFERFENSDSEEVFIHRANPRGNLCVELHWELHNFLGVERNDRVSDLFTRAVELKTPDLTFECLHRVDALVHTTLHLIMTHNQDMRLLWIHDIALLAQSLTVPEDWKLLQERSSIWGARLSIEKSLKIAQVWADLQLPKGFDEFSMWAEPAEAEIIAMNNTLLRHTRPSIYLKLFLSNSPTISGKILSLLKLIFPSPDRVRSRYPPSHRWLLPISYVRRWWKWFVKSIRR